MKNKTKNSLLVFLIAALLLLTACNIKGNDKNESEIKATEESTDKLDSEKIEQQSENTNAEKNNEGSEETIQSTGSEIYNKEISFTSFPTEISFELPENTIIKAEYEADKEVQFIVYSEFMYNKWKETGAHSISKANTKTTAGCCQKKASFSFDINKGEGGKYYFVFDNKDTLTENIPTKARLIVRK